MVHTRPLPLKKLEEVVIILPLSLVSPSAKRFFDRDGSCRSSQYIRSAQRRGRLWTTGYSGSSCSNLRLNSYATRHPLNGN